MQIITNTSQSMNSIMKTESEMDEENSEDEDLTEEQFEQLEFIIQYLLDSLKDAESVVRWAAAKGIGRVTMRLNRDFADQIVQQLVDLFA